MKKLKVSKEIKENLDELINGIESKEGIIKHHINCGWGGYTELNKLTLEQLTIALFIGYESEKTPEELLKESYFAPVRPEHKDFDKGFKLGILKSLESLNIEIKGINS